MNMERQARLYSLSYNEGKTYLWAALFVGCNLALPHLFHLIPQGGIIFAPLSLVVLCSAYKLGWKVGLLTAIASPLLNHLFTGLPAMGVLPVMVLKLAVLALVGGLAAQHFKHSSLLLLIGVVLTAEFLSGLGELALTGGLSATLADFSIGWPGLLLQVVVTYLVCKYL